MNYLGISRSRSGMLILASQHQNEEQNHQSTNRYPEHIRNLPPRRPPVVCTPPPHYSGPKESDNVSKPIKFRLRQLGIAESQLNLEWALCFVANWRQKSSAGCSGNGQRRVTAGRFCVKIRNVKNKVWKISRKPKLKRTNFRLFYKAVTVLR